MAILFNNIFEFKVQKVKRDENGYRLILTIEIEGRLFTLINIYGPNKDDPEFYKQLLLKVNEKENTVIMVGDFNLILSPEVDFVNYANLNNLKARDDVFNLMILINFIDVWREF